MIVAVIQYKNHMIAKQQIRQVQAIADGIELRLDYLHVLDCEALRAVRQQFDIPMIFTLRKKSQGGFYSQDETQRLQDIMAMCAIGPDYIDLEYDISPDFVAELQLRYPRIRLICSYHNFKETPADLMAILQSMRRPYFDAYKLAVTANNTLDALRLMQFIIKNNTSNNLTGISMGEAGQSTRILSSVLGNKMHYASCDASQITAPGQLSLHALLNIYGFRKLNTASKIYALLGDPVDLSVGHLLHNQSVQLLDNHAVYIKLQLTEHELPEVMHQCRQLPFAGLSITMPLKQSIIPLLDGIDPLAQPIKAINSVVLEKGKWIGFNTDGVGAIAALAERIDLAMQTVVILGAGGAARAIAYEALQRHAHVIILNRTQKKAVDLAEELGCTGGDFARLRDLSYTVLINALPLSAYADQSCYAWLNLGVLSVHVLAMDIVYNPIQTPFLQLAEQAGCTCIFGYEMYINQAIMQIMRWFDPSTQELQKIKQKMLDYFLDKIKSAVRVDLGL